MDMEKTLPTRGQLERQLSQTLQSLYRQQFGHLLHKVTCHLFADKVAIVAEGSITNLEEILFGHSKVDLARSIRMAISEAFTAQVKQAVSQILEVGIIDIIADSTIETGYIGIIIFLDSAPEIRLAKKNMYQNRSFKVKSD